MTHLHRIVRGSAWALAASVVLTACNDRVPPQGQTPPPEPPAQVEGIATPASVAVVTATNAD